MEVDVNANVNVNLNLEMDIGTDMDCDPIVWKIKDELEAFREDDEARVIDARLQ
jgi:hypothetical protein